MNNDPTAATGSSNTGKKAVHVKVRRMKKKTL